MKNFYEHNKIKNWYQFWHTKNVFEPDYKKENTYCITIPPPNITGKLHMGHAFQCTIIDFLIRYYKMNNYSVLCKMGTDHAGIATQILIEQKLKNNKNKNYLKFSKKWKKKSIKNINDQIKNLGCLINWKTRRFTLDKHFSFAVQKAFIQLYKENLIYKIKTLVNWDPGLKTAISDLEIIYEEKFIKIYYIKYKILNSSNYVTIATTRPETIFADIAIAINPTDSRYINFIKYKVEVPLIKRIIPIIYDESIDKEFGTGCVKITPAHDFKDFEISKKHKLDIINILNKNGTLNNNVPEKYKNLNIPDARELIEKDLKSLNLIHDIKNYKTKIPVADRTNNTLEPFLTEQWYVKTMPLIKPVEEAIKSKKISIVPNKWEKTFLNWIFNIKDWCISRQIWWGHKIPAWYDDEKNIYVGENEKIIRKNYNINPLLKIYQDEDVLDTWFSSALWPFASLGWPKNTKEFKKFYPTNTLVTGFDIIFFWVIRMLMFGIKFTNNIPFNEIFIHGLIRDNYGNKMSKTKGNVIDPSDIINGISHKNLINKQTTNLLNDKLKDEIKTNIEKQFPKGIDAYGTDALRLTFMSLTTDNISLKLNLEKVKKYKNFCNKLWNAFNFINIQEYSSSTIKKKYNLFNNWINSIWQTLKQDVNFYIEKRKLFLVSDIIYKFVWNEFCDWYIEITKIFLQNIFYKTLIKNNINNIFDEMLKILHPIIPFITEEIWHRKNSSNDLLIFSNYPKPDFKLVNKISEKKINIFKEKIITIRNFKTINPEIKLIYIIPNLFNEFLTLEETKPVLIKLTKIKKILIIIDKKTKFLI